MTLAISWRPLRQLFSLLQRLVRASEAAQVFTCALGGGAIGCLVAGLRRGIEGLHQFFFRLPDGMGLSTGLGVAPGRVLFVPLLGGLLLGVGALAVRRLGAREVVDPIEANALHGGRLSLPASLRLVMATIVSNASGAAVGMEAGYSQLGAGFLAAIGEKLSLRRADQRIFVSAGAAAAIAAAFNAPLAGAFYGFELILGTYTMRALAPVAAAALAAVLAERGLIGPQPLFLVGQVFHFKLAVYLLFALLGVFSAAFGILAMQSVTWAEHALKHARLPQWLRPAIGGICLTQMAILLPQILGSGHAAIQYLFDHEWPLATLLLVLVAKLAASAISIGSGYRGGMFSSSLFLGCMFGAVFADVTAFLVPRLGEQHVALMMVGMGSVAAAVIGAPLTMVFLVLEATGDFPMTVAVMVGVIISATLVRLTFGYSFSTWRFHQRGLGIHSAHDVGWLANLTVGALMRADPKLVDSEMPVTSLREMYPLGSAKLLFVAEKGQLIGAIDVSRLHETQADPQTAGLAARDLAERSEAFLLPWQNVRVALNLFNAVQVETLPVVVSANDRQVIGYLTEAYALRRYNQELEIRRSAETGMRDLFPISEPAESARRRVS
jgi:CIC family chloride channel protein